MNLMKTNRFRLFVSLSVLWMVVLMVASRRGDMALSLLIFGFPVWGFWTSVWIWPLKFNRIFNIGNEVEKRKELKQWVYLDAEIAKKSELYGITGWAYLLFLAIILSVVLSVVALMELRDTINILKELTRDFVNQYPGYELLSPVSSVQTIVVIALLLMLGYLLMTHKESFQKFFIVVFFIALISDVILSIWMANVMNLSFEDILKTPTFVTHYIGSAIWLFYVIKSKRINLTTKKRIRRKYLDEYIPKDREDAEKKYENTPSS